MPHDKDLNIDKGTGVGTDGSLRSAKEDLYDHGADRSPDRSDGVGTDGSLVNPEKETVDPADDADSEYESEHTERDAATGSAFTERDTGMNPR